MKYVVANLVAYDVCFHIDDDLVDACISAGQDGKIAIGGPAVLKLSEAIREQFDDILNEQLIRFDGVDIIQVGDHHLPPSVPKDI